jgi:hypothetical protein
LGVGSGEHGHDGAGGVEVEKAGGVKMKSEPNPSRSSSGTPARFSTERRRSTWGGSRATKTTSARISGLQAGVFPGGEERYKGHFADLFGALGGVAGVNEHDCQRQFSRRLCRTTQQKRPAVAPTGSQYGTLN